MTSRSGKITRLIASTGRHEQPSREIELSETHADNDGNPRERLYTALSAIPAGKVISYGELAALAGHPGAARWAGSLMRQLPADSDLPWHRVVRACGRLGLNPDSPSHGIQCARLAREGVQIRHNKIDLRIYGYTL